MKLDGRANLELSGGFCALLHLMYLTFLSREWDMSLFTNTPRVKALYCLDLGKRRLWALEMLGNATRVNRRLWVIFGPRPSCGCSILYIVKDARRARPSHYLWPLSTFETADNFALADKGFPGTLHLRSSTKAENKDR